MIWLALITAVNVGQQSGAKKYPILLLLFAVALAAAFFSGSFFGRVYRYITRREYVLRCCVFAVGLLGLAARFAFLLFEYVPASDPLQFFNNAAALSQTGMIDDPSYVAMFPFLFAYDALLAVVFKITGSGLLGVILLNTVFDVLASLLAGYLIFLLTASRKWGILACAVWWISPFNITFCAISLPLIVVNTLILLVLVLLVHMFKSAGNFKHILIFSTAVAVALAVQEAFRPVTVITIIAIVAYYVILVIKKRKLQCLWRCVCSVLVIALLSGILNYGWTQIVSCATGLPPSTNTQGYSIYVGSNYGNYQPGGGWSPQDENDLGNLLKEYDGDYSKAFGQLQTQGIERWKQLGSAKAFTHLVNKSMQLGGDTHNMIYNLPGCYPYIDSHALMNVAMRGMCAVYWFLMLGCALWFSLWRKHSKKLDIIVFMNILTIGLFLAFMMLEVANRYFSIFFPMFTVFAVLGMKDAFEKFKTEKETAYGKNCR